MCAMSWRCTFRCVSRETLIPRIGAYSSKEQASRGGESHLASCATIYNEIAAVRPDVLQTLAEPNWVFDKYVNEFPNCRSVELT